MQSQNIFIENKKKFFPQTDAQPPSITRKRISENFSHELIHKKEKKLTQQKKGILIEKLFCVCCNKKLPDQRESITDGKIPSGRAFS